MLIGALHKKIGPVLGLRGLTTRELCQIKNEMGEIVDEFLISAYWIAEIRSYEVFNTRIKHIKREGMYEYLTVAILRTNKGNRGLILIPPIRERLDRELGGPYPLKPLDLGDWNDPLTNSLGCVNLLPDNNLLQQGTTYYECAIEFVAGNASHGAMEIEGPAGGNFGLWDALLKTTYHLVDLYDDDEMREFVNQK